MARDLFHNAVKNALIKDGWQITDDLLSSQIGSIELYLNLFVYSHIYAI